MEFNHRVDKNHLGQLKYQQYATENKNRMTLVICFCKLVHQNLEENKAL